MNISMQGVEITNRFFQAIDILIANKVIRGLATFTRAHNINRWNLVTVRKDPEHNYLRTEYIQYLCKDYNISPRWIIMGTGAFYEYNND